MHVGPKRVHTVRVRGGNTKFRGIRLESGVFSWGSECASLFVVFGFGVLIDVISFTASTKKTRIIDVVYNATNNELVRTKTLVKGAIVQIDATPFRQWYEAHYGVALGRKKKDAVEAEEKKQSGHVKAKLAGRAARAPVEPALVEQFGTGRVFARIASRPGQSGRCDGYILEGKELDFYVRKLKTKK